MLDFRTPRDYQHALTLDSSAAVDDHGDTPWKASMRKEWESRPLKAPLWAFLFQLRKRSAGICLQASGSTGSSGTDVTSLDSLLLAVIKASMD